MSAEVETMMYAGRVKPWHGLGRSIDNAPNSEDALIYAGLDWKVIQRPIYTADGTPCQGYKANVRDSDNSVLGIVGEKYRVIQNHEAFAFTDALLGNGVTYETAGALKEGKRVWMLAKLPERYFFGGDEVEPYLVVTNSHDGSSGIKVAMTPVRVVCQNTLNFALKTARRSWSAYHTGNISGKLEEAKDTLNLAHSYMTELGKTVSELSQKKLSDRKVTGMFERLIPVPEKATDLQIKNIANQRYDLWKRYFEAPDLMDLNHSAYRFMNAVSDFATHSEPIRKTANYKENLFMRTMDGNQLIDKAYQMVMAA